MCPRDHTLQNQWIFEYSQAIFLPKPNHRWFKTASCRTWSLMILFVFFVALIIFSSLGNAIIILILYPQLSGKAKSRTSRHFKIKISLAASDLLPSITVFPFMIYYLILNFRSSNPTSEWLLKQAYDSQHSIWVNFSGNDLWQAVCY